MAGGDTKQRINDLETENAILREAVKRMSNKPTLRDRFAIAAMHVVGANTAWQRPIDAAEAARTAYGLADEMMLARKEKE